MSEHVRIELLDPRWKQQRQDLLDKQRETSYTDANSISENLSRLARNRADVFIETDDQVPRRLHTCVTWFCVLYCIISILPLVRFWFLWGLF